MAERLRASALDSLAARVHGSSVGLLNGWSRSDILALIGVVMAVLSVVTAIVPPFRHFAQSMWRGLMLRAGLPRRRYARWFVKEWGIYDNPYLDAIENLDLRNTYVPLSFRSDDEAQETLTLATEVLERTDTGNLIINGGPGSGKSTLLKAYGVGILQDRPLWDHGPRVVPFLVQLRNLARFLSAERGLADYLVEKVLVAEAGAEAGMSLDRARKFLNFSLERRQVLVMLDGLDEVMTEAYENVRLAIFDFINDHNPDRPTYLAKVLLTCRRQNFLSLRDDWVPAFSKRECALAPLRNSEIFSYLDKTRRLFKSPAVGPENFMQAVRASGTLDLHRIPLILAMSVGLYARKDYFQIPSSIAELYRKMIEEMLDRHSFRRDPSAKALKFQVADKARFLREFSLHAAEKSGGFDHFGRTDLVDFCESLAPQLNAVRSDPAGLVDEVIQRSGLLADVIETGSYVFAHRSIQEYLVAEQLRARDNGDGFLVGKATDQEWRQVIQFYTAGQEQRRIDGFLQDLSARNPELAAYCLQGAQASDEVAGAILDALRPIDRFRLPAVAAATLSPRIPIQEMAIDRLCAAFSASGNALSAVTADVDGMLPLLNSLAGTNAAQIAALVPQIVSNLPDDPRLVEPLWRCLTAPSIERLTECRAIVQRLLNLVIDPNSFEELARQDKYDRDFLTADLRRQAYPFNAGLDRSHNLVTLLAWAEYLDIVPPQLNRFFEAKAAGRLSGIESDRRRTISFSLFWLARILTVIEFFAFPVAILIAVTDPRQLLQPFGWWTPLLWIGIASVPAVLFFGLATLVDGLPEKSRVRDYLTPETRGPNTASAVILIGRLLGAITPTNIRNMEASAIAAAVFAIAIFPLSLAVSAMPVITRSHAGYIFLVFGMGLFYWMTAIRLFDRRRRYYIFRPNEFVDVYSDPRSRHWLGRPDSKALDAAALEVDMSVDEQ